MKKKRNFRILSILLCFVFLFLVGCEGGPGGFDDDTLPKSLDGVKVLSKPATYSFSDAVGEQASENYYNIFAKEMLEKLYDVYMNHSHDPVLTLNIYKDLDTANGETFNTLTGENENYLYDSLRYSISKVEQTTDEDGNLSWKITLDTNAKWLWTYGLDIESTFLKNLAGSSDGYFSFDNNVFTIDSEYYINLERTNWLSIFTETDYQQLYPDLRAKYWGEAVNKDSSSVINYYKSPYYEKYVESATSITQQNFFQDALEYATYLFVLGYDYVERDDNGVSTGTATEDAPLFDFEVQANDVKVGGWGAQKISVVEALKNVKTLYQELGNYVGLTNTNKTQIKDFILNKVIGSLALSKNIVEIDLVNYESIGGSTIESATQPTDLKFNRNYNKIVENIVNYACSQAPIGYDNGTETKLNLDQNYLVSEITDYSGDYFFASYDNNSDDDLFRYIDAKQYQSMVFNPREENVGEHLSDIWLMFEYFENPLNQQMLDSLTINVGFRYFNSRTGELINKQVPFEVKCGANGEVAGEDADVNWLYIGYSTKDSSFYDIALPTEIPLTRFKSNNHISPFVGTLVPGQFYASKFITGNDDARKYYKSNDSSSYGVYGTLNEEMFSVANVGEDAASDIFEVYFDVVKLKGVTGVNYNFKVALFAFVSGC